MQAPEFFDDLEFDPGRLLDHRYQIVALLGSGGMGRVYKAFHALLDAPVALKELRVLEVASPEERERVLNRFCREARLLTSLRHPNIPRVLDYFAEDSSYYLVMDYIEGTTLAERLNADSDSDERAPLPLAEALDYASQLCDVLVYLHSQQPAVVFGDLKPSNVILTLDDRAVMVDFGVARPSATHSETPLWMWGLGGTDPSDSSDTQPLGTPGYAAPEQYERGWRADPRSDIFALGVLLYEMVTGHAPPPFPFGFQPVRLLNPALPGALEELIERALCFNPDGRFQSAAEMYQALRLVAQEVAFQQFQTEAMVIPPGLTAPQLIVPARGSGSRRQRLHLRQRLLASAGAAGVMAAIALGLLLFGLTSGNHKMAQSPLNHPLAAASTPTNTPMPLPTDTPTERPHPKASPAPNHAPTPTATPALTPTPTASPTETPTPTPTETPTPAGSPTPTNSPTPAGSPTPPGSPTPTSLPTPPGSPTPTSLPAPPGSPTPGTMPPGHRPTGTPLPFPMPTWTPGEPPGFTGLSGASPTSPGNILLLGALVPVLLVTIRRKRR